MEILNFKSSVNIKLIDVNQFSLIIIPKTTTSSGQSKKIQSSQIRIKLCQLIHNSIIVASIKLKLVFILFLSVSNLCMHVSFMIRKYKKKTFQIINNFYFLSSLQFSSSVHCFISFNFHSYLQLISILPFFVMYFSNCNFISQINNSTFTSYLILIYLSLPFSSLI